MSENVNTLEEMPAPQREARKKLLIIQRLMLAAGVLSFVFMMYTGWWLVAALVAELLALGLGIRSLFLMPRARSGGFEYTVLILFLLGITYLTFGTVVQLVFVEQTNAYAECIQNALTLSRQGQCNQQLQDNLLGALLGSE
ncbi:Uncharacterised protein [Mycobacteroides abscessus subsp. abscessus]|nr:Uncharacterised protein [Mycobacteroides abscessus subsp. abscessus]